MLQASFHVCELNLSYFGIQFGNFQNIDEMRKAKAMRKDFGRFFYRFPNGESGLDVYNRVSSFISTVFRDVNARREVVI